MTLILDLQSDPKVKAYCKTHKGLEQELIKTLPEIEKSFNGVVPVKLRATFKDNQLTIRIEMVIKGYITKENRVEIWSLDQDFYKYWSTQVKFYYRDLVTWLLDTYDDPEDM